MAIFEKDLTLSDSQAVTADAGSTNVIETDGVQQIGRGEPMAVIFHINVAADATTGDETYSFVLQTDSDSAFGSPREMVRMAVPAAELKAGSVHFLSIPKTNEKYIRAYYDVGGTTPSVTVTAYLSLQSAANTGTDQFYPSGWSV